jgi:hypothetical protein
MERDRARRSMVLLRRWTKAERRRDAEAGRFKQAGATRIRRSKPSPSLGSSGWGAAPLFFRSHPPVQCQRRLVRCASARDSSPSVKARLALVVM